MVAGLEEWLRDGKVKKYYEILGVDRGATSKEVTSMYRRLALKYHPDKNPDSSARKTFHDITEAYAILCDGLSRKAYDQVLVQDEISELSQNQYTLERLRMKMDLERREDDNAREKSEKDKKKGYARVSRTSHQSQKTGPKLGQKSTTRF